jgi:pimeloyl-ACP methyl ester carboxylesterase
MFHWDATDAMAGLVVPLLVLGGDRDIIIKLEASRNIASVAAADLEVIEGVNHMGFLERSDLYNLAIKTFAARIGREARPTAIDPAPNLSAVAGGALDL